MCITTLPVEVISEISSYLDLSEWFALRLTCSALYEKTFEDYAEEFTMVRFIATRDSLDALEALSEMDVVAGNVQQLWMIPTVFDGQHELSREEFADSDWAVSSKSCLKIQGEELDARYAAYQSIVADHLDLVRSDLTTRLARCFRRFKNLERIGQIHVPTPYLLDPRQESSRCLGYRSLKKQIDFRYGNYFPSQVFWPSAGRANSRVLSKVLLAVIESDSHLKSLSTCGRNCARTALDLDLSPGQYDCLLSVLDELREIHICISYDECIGRPPNSKTTLEFLYAVAPKLEILSLSHNLQGREVPDLVYFQELTQRIEFTQLRMLHFHSIRVTPNDLRAFFRKAKTTLTFLNLTCVILDDDPPRSEDIPASAFDQAIFYNDRAEQRWKELWDIICEDLSLETFIMADIGYCDRSMGTKQVSSDFYEARVTWDSQTSEISLREWFDKLYLVLRANPNHPQPGFYGQSLMLPETHLLPLLTGNRAVQVYETCCRTWL